MSKIKRPTHYVKVPGGGVQLVFPEGMNPALTLHRLPADYWKRPRRFDEARDAFVIDDEAEAAAARAERRRKRGDFVEYVERLEARIETLEAQVAALTERTTDHGT